MLKSAKTRWIILAVVIAAVIALPFIADSAYLRSLIITICIYSIYAMSYDLLLGYTGIASFGHAIYFGLGAYIVAYMTVRLHWHPVAALILVIAACIVVSFVIGFISVRVKNLYFNMVTMALGQLFYVLAAKLYKITGGDDGLPGVRNMFPNKTVFYVFIVILMVAVYFFCRRIVNSPTGKVLQAIKNNEGRVALLGYDTLKFKMLIIQISGILAGIVGAFYVTHVGIAYPTLLHSSLTLQALFMVVLGGSGTLYGGIIGAVIMRLADSILSRFTTRWMLILGVIFILAILFFPKGTVGAFGKLAEKLRKNSKPGNHE